MIPVQVNKLVTYHSYNIIYTDDPYIYTQTTHIYIHVHECGLQTPWGGAAIEKTSGWKHLYDFPDFAEVVGQSGPGTIDVIQLQNQHVLSWKGGQSQAKLKKGSAKLSPMVQIQLRRGSGMLFYKTSHDESRYTELNFLKRNFDISSNPPTLRDVDRGIPERKKTDTLAKLTPYMPNNRKSFWDNLLISETSEDIDE